MAGKDMPYFVLHEHHSKRLHYDFRLEMDGVLKSWAVPKGPSMAPKDKRLAVLVEDHPMEYGAFEGIIPDGHYGAGPVVIWDAGDYDPILSDLLAGKMEFRLKGRKLKGLFVLTRLKGTDKEWLMIKKNDDFAQPTFEIKPALTEEKRMILEERIPPCDTD
jgi:bifunctional non-homologous end joining protein LigD